MMAVTELLCLWTKIGLYWSRCFVRPLQKGDVPEGWKKANTTWATTALCLWSGLYPSALILQLSSRGRAAHLLPLFFLAHCRICSSRSLERLMEGQAEVRMLLFTHPWLCQVCGANGVSLCRKESSVCHLASGEGWGAMRNACTSLVVLLRGNRLREPGRAKGPTLLCSGCWCCVAACWWLFLLWGCSLSTAWFLQTDAKQGPLPAPFGNGGGLCCSSGEFGEKGRKALHRQSSCNLGKLVYYQS